MVALGTRFLAELGAQGGLLATSDANGAAHIAFAPQTPESHIVFSTQTPESHIIFPPQTLDFNPDALFDELIQGLPNVPYMNDHSSTFSTTHASTGAPNLNVGGGFSSLKDDSENAIRVMRERLSVFEGPTIALDTTTFYWKQKRNQSPVDGSTTIMAWAHRTSGGPRLLEPMQTKMGRAKLEMRSWCTFWEDVTVDDWQDELCRDGGIGPVDVGARIRVIEEHLAEGEVHPSTEQGHHS